MSGAAADESAPVGRPAGVRSAGFGGVMHTPSLLDSPSHSLVFVYLDITC